MTISYAITVWNEHVELKRLLLQLTANLKLGDEIVIQGDQGKVTDGVISVIHSFLKKFKIKYVEYPLNRNFANFKNNLFKNCEGDYIFQIDADEYLAEPLMKNIHDLLQENIDLDAIAIPRKNTVVGLTDEYAKSQGWWINIIDGERVNCWPDYQVRIFKNKPEIRLTNSVHEQLSGYKTIGQFPDVTDWALIHPKTFERQVQQNEFYKTC